MTNLVLWRFGNDNVGLYDYVKHAILKDSGLYR